MKNDALHVVQLPFTFQSSSHPFFLESFVVQDKRFSSPLRPGFGSLKKRSLAKMSCKHANAIMFYRDRR